MAPHVDSIAARNSCLKHWAFVKRTIVVKTQGLKCQVLHAHDLTVQKAAREELDSANAAYQSLKVQAQNEPSGSACFADVMSSRSGKPCAEGTPVRRLLRPSLTDWRGDALSHA